MFTSQTLKRDELLLIPVFNTRANIFENAVQQLNNPESLSLGEAHGKICTIDSIEDEKGIKNWFDLSEAKLTKYIKADPAELENLYSEYKETEKKEKKGLLNVQGYAEADGFVAYYI
eukprot:TRINITY_DN14260_c0_g1_i2.p2 TRINITY_DN14260_c0_g1~~TRINITY_DN14260_c0_g1_i2.p2  ORF type:complete len:117 (-),score=33.44 TRINITY_DN14260_c0_g1_i2:655-1005(-)